MVESLELYSSAHLPNLIELVKEYIRGKTIYVQFNGTGTDVRRTNSIGKVEILNMQDLMHNETDYGYYRYRNTAKRTDLPVSVEQYEKHHGFHKIMPQFRVTWEGRRNYHDCSTYQVDWLKGYEGSTEWVWKTPDEEQTKAFDKLGRELTVGDFISYILYHFDNAYNAAGLYYGKITKIEKNGTVWAKNIKLTEKDKSEDKMIKDNSLIVQMSKDLLDRLMLARLSF